MNEEIILESLKHNIPVEYVRSCDTSDGIGYYEEDTESWQYQLYNYINYLQKQNTELKEQVEELKHIMYVIRDDNGLNHLWCKDMILDWLGSDSK